MRNKFDEELEILNTELVEMGGLIESAIANAVKSIKSDSEEYIDTAAEYEKETDEKETDIETRCLRLILMQQPVARDLRLISAAMKMVTDMERIGDQALDISEISLMIKDKADIEKFKHIEEMARFTIEMVNNSINAFIKRDTELANSVIASDDRIDALFNETKKDIIELILRDAKKGEEAMDILLTAKYFERIGDHATNIAEWVVFSITGRLAGK